MEDSHGGGKATILWTSLSGTLPGRLTIAKQHFSECQATFLFVNNDNAKSTGTLNYQIIDQDRYVSLEISSQPYLAWPVISFLPKPPSSQVIHFRQGASIDIKLEGIPTTSIIWHLYCTLILLLLLLHLTG